MAEFDKFYKTLLRHEGGFVDHPNDPGGATNMGITIGTFRLHATSLLGIEPTIENLKRLTKEQAAIIYKSQYWDAIDGDNILSQAMAEQYFDFYVNAGGNAVRTMDRCLRGVAIGEKSPPGLARRHTKAMTVAINSAYKEGRIPSLYVDYRQQRIAYYEWIIRRNPALSVFERGWMRRAKSFKAY